MELIVINENKLKITLTRDEMSELGLDENEFHLSLTDTRKILDRILHSSPEIGGFTRHETGEKLLLQLYPERNGGCELYVTRLCIDDESEKGGGQVSLEEKPLLPQKALQLSVGRRPLLCYSFLEIGDVMRACRALERKKTDAECSLFMGDDSKLYLFLSYERQENEKSSPSSVLSEFGELENAERSMLLMMERGRKIISGNVIEKLSSL